jgi:hypothetical protein
MEKQERFAIYAYVHGFFDGKDYTTNKRIFVTDVIEYPSDEQMELAWKKAKNEYTQVFYLNVEKQVRFN